MPGGLGAVPAQHDENESTVAVDLVQRLPAPLGLGRDPAALLAAKHAERSATPLGFPLLLPHTPILSTARCPSTLPSGQPCPMAGRSGTRATGLGRLG
jgi:hypothetical protein